MKVLLFSLVMVVCWGTVGFDKDSGDQVVPNQYIVVLKEGSGPFRPT